MYYRVGNKNENLIETTSVELATELHNISLEEIFETYGVEDEDELEGILDDELFFDSEGHFGAGIYYNGVCCCDSIESLKSYFGVGVDSLNDSVVFVFEGDQMGTCNDGEVVIPTELVETLNIEVLK